MEILPDRKTYETTLTVGRNGVSIDIPLNVAPPADLRGFAVEKAGQSPFERYLLERVAGNRSCDLNGDGKTDYLDDYIFMANFIVAGAKRATGINK